MHAAVFRKLVAFTDLTFGTNELPISFLEALILTELRPA